MKTGDIQTLAAVAAKNIRTEKDLNEFKQLLTKMTLETALNAELDEHLGYDKHEKSNTKNSRNGYSTKTLQTENDEFELKTPRDRNNDFEPELVKKKRRRFISISDKILFLYAQGMTTREVVTTLKYLYDTEIFAANEMTIDSLWTSMPIKSILDCVMSISEPVNEGLHFHIMALAASLANPR